MAAAILTEPGAAPQVVAMATGTKCLGGSQVNSGDRGEIICDSHAEVLVRRSLLRLFYKELTSIAENNGDTTQSKWFTTTNPDGANFDELRCRPIFHLRMGLKLHLYISQTPCGDASIYSTERGAPFHSMDAFSEIKPTACIRDFNKTGAKPATTICSSGNPTQFNFLPISSSQEEAQMKESKLEEFQAVGILRRKSGRSDLNSAQQTLSMSCSDKLLRSIATPCRICCAQVGMFLCR